MIRYLKVTLIIVIGIMSIYAIWLNLPVKFNKFQQIKRGNHLIENIEDYRSEFGKLPENNDWQVLKEIGFNQEELDISYPEYSKINDSTYELIFIDGFDGPYLLWNSKNKEWKKGNPSFQK